MTTLMENKLYCVEVPSDATEIQTWNHGIGFKTNMLDRKPDDSNGFYHTETGLFKMKGFKILGEVTEDDFSFDVEPYVLEPVELNQEDYEGNMFLKSFYWDYDLEYYWLTSFEESYRTLLESKGIDLSKENVKWVILLRNIQQ